MSPRYVYCLDADDTVLAYSVKSKSEPGVRFIPPKLLSPQLLFWIMAHLAALAKLNAGKEPNAKIIMNSHRGLYLLEELISFAISHLVNLIRQSSAEEEKKAAPSVTIVSDDFSLEDAFLTSIMQNLTDMTGLKVDGASLPHDHLEEGMQYGDSFKRLATVEREVIETKKQEGSFTLYGHKMPLYGYVIPPKKDLIKRFGEGIAILHDPKSKVKQTLLIADSEAKLTPDRTVVLKKVDDIVDICQGLCAIRPEELYENIILEVYHHRASIQNGVELVGVVKGIKPLPVKKAESRLDVAFDALAGLRPYFRSGPRFYDPLGDYTIKPLPAPADSKAAPALSVASTSPLGSASAHQSMRALTPDPEPVKEAQVRKSALTPDSGPERKIEDTPDNRSSLLNRRIR